MTVAGTSAQVSRGRLSPSNGIPWRFAGFVNEVLATGCSRAHGRVARIVRPMRALIQRVERASVTVDTEVTGQIGAGLLALIGVKPTDSQAEAEKLASKVWNLRIFEDEAGKMNLSASDRNLSVLVVSQFTLYGDASNGRRPSFIEAARPEHAEPLIESLMQHLRTLGANVESGRFRTDMKVELVNDGPITLMVEV